jgi:Ca2+-binding RTX toxin-like protein
VTVSLAAVGAQDTFGAGTDTLTNFEGLLGSNFDDHLTGNGNSVLEGGAGDDHLTGVSGQNDTASYAHATAGVLVDLDLDGISQDTHGAGSDTLTNIANLQGSQFNDILTGNSADNILFGNGGNDTFVFNQTFVGIGHDTIGDFVSGQDHIALDYAAFDSSGPNDFSHWLQNHATASGGDVLIDLNPDGTHPNQDTILLKNVALANLHANDFIIPSGHVS